MVLLAVDLAADERNETGIAILDRGRIATSTVHGDGEILALASWAKPSLIGIDAPLSLPHGRRSIDERDSNHFRECDLRLRELGIRFFPITIGGMRRLTRRGMALKGKLEERGFKVVEIFPGASFDMLGIRRKDVEAANRFLRCDAKNAHESDAAIGAYTLMLLEKGGAVLLSGRDGAIAIPRRPRGSPSSRCP